MSKEYIISVPDDAGFVEYSYIRGGRKYNTHYAYRSMECLVRCGECKYFEPKEDWCYWRDEMITADGFCSYGVNSSEKTEQFGKE